MSERDRGEAGAGIDYLASITGICSSGDSDIAMERSETIHRAIAERFDRKKIVSSTGPARQSTQG